MARRLGTRRILVVGLMVLGVIGAFVGGAYGNHVFSDVPNNAFYHDEVTWLAGNGIVAGCGGGKYCPNDPITRGQAAEILYKYATRTRVGHFSCDAYGFSPRNSTQSFSIGINGAISNGLLACPVHVPNGSTITKFQVKFYDANAGDAQCFMDRQDLVNTNAYAGMAVVQTTGMSGYVLLTDSSVQLAGVDNSYYSYYIGCTMDVEAGDLTVLGVIVEYTFKGIPAP